MKTVVGMKKREKKKHLSPQMPDAWLHPVQRYNRTLVVFGFFFFLYFFYGRVRRLPFQIRRRNHRTVGIVDRVHDQRHFGPPTAVRVRVYHVARQRHHPEP